MVTIVKEVNFGIANTYKTEKGHLIEINYKLQEFPKLREKIVEHEFEHAKAKSFWKNRKVDALTDLKFKDLFPVYKKYPKLFFQQHLPFNYSKEKKTLFIDWSLIFLYSFYIGIGIGIYSLIKLFSKDSIFFWKVIKYIAIILGASFLVYQGGKRLRKSVNEEAQRLTSKKNLTEKQKLKNLSSGL